MVTKIPVPTSAITINGIEPIGYSEEGKFFMNSIFPGKDQTDSKRSTPPNIKTTMIAQKNSNPAVDFFI